MSDEITLCIRFTPPKNRNERSIAGLKQEFLDLVAELESAGRIEKWESHDEWMTEE